MRNTTGKRDDLKAASRHRILDTAARRLRRGGVDGTAIVPVMREAGLTHGTFYSHFGSKGELAVAAFSHAITTGRPRWTKARKGEEWTDRLQRLARQYLTSKHRDDMETSCGFSALSSDAARGSPEFRAAYERELRLSLAAICEGADDDPSRLDDAIAMMAICVGGLSLARAVPDKEFSERILRVARTAAANITAND